MKAKRAFPFLSFPFLSFPFMRNSNPPCMWRYNCRLGPCRWSHFACTRTSPPWSRWWFNTRQFGQVVQWVSKWVSEWDEQDSIPRGQKLGQATKQASVWWNLNMDWLHIHVHVQVSIQFTNTHQSACEWNWSERFPFVCSSVHSCWLNVSSFRFYLPRSTSLRTVRSQREEVIQSSNNLWVTGTDRSYKKKQTNKQR